MSVCAELNLALRKFVRNYGIPLSKLSIKLGVAPEECLRWWADEKKQIPTHKIQQLTQILGVSEEDFILDRIQSVAVDEAILGFRSTINPKYAENAFSYILSSKHVVEFIGLRYGNRVLNSILYKLGVPRSYFDNIKNRISLRFYEDLLREFVALGNSYEEIHGLSKCIFLTTEEDPDGKRLFPKRMTYAQALQTVYESTRSFDENFEYVFEIRPTRVRIVTRPSEKLVEVTKNKRYGSRELYEYRSRLFENMVMLCGLPPLKMTVRKCVSQGDDCSIYEAEYPSHGFLGRLA